MSPVGCGHRNLMGRGQAGPLAVPGGFRLSQFSSTHPLGGGEFRALSVTGFKSTPIGGCRGLCTDPIYAAEP